MSEGYIPLFRKITNCWVWQDKPFSKGQAWVDLLLMANHADGKIPLGNELIPVKAGQVVTSEQKLMARWGWSKSKVRAFLQMLESDLMLVKKTCQKRTTLTLCNYKYYSDSANHKQTVKKPSSDPINNVKNEEEEYIPPLSPLEKAVEDFKEFRKGIKKPMTEKAVALLHGKLNQLAGDDEQKKIAILEQSIFNGWQGVFDLKTDIVTNQTLPPSKPKRYKIITDENGKEVSVLDE